MSQQEWLLKSNEPWTHYRIMVDLLERPEDDKEVVEARVKMLAHPQIQSLITKAAAWGVQPLKRHNDSSHPIYALVTLADFGLRASDNGIQPIIEQILKNQSAEGAFLSPLLIPQAYGGSGEMMWSWVACDAPLLLYVLLSMGDARIHKASEHLSSLVCENGYRCAASADLAGFKGPGKHTAPCPIANLIALKALSLLPAEQNKPSIDLAIQMLLDFWKQRKEKKYFLFGMGTDFNKLKLPFVWFDLLHVLEVLSRFPSAISDARYHEMLHILKSNATPEGNYIATSAYQAWKGWSFADKKYPSPWLTFIVERILKRSQAQSLN